MQGVTRNRQQTFSGAYCCFLHPESLCAFGSERRDQGTMVLRDWSCSFWFAAEEPSSSCTQRLPIVMVDAWVLLLCLVLFVCSSVSCILGSMVVNLAPTDVTRGLWHVHGTHKTLHKAGSHKTQSSELHESLYPHSCCSWTSSLVASMLSLPKELTSANICTEHVASQ